VTKPTPGLCLPVSVLKVRDGDTVLVRFPQSEREWAVRLLDCWAPELSTGEQRQQAAAAKEFLKEVLANGEGDLLLHIPPPESGNLLRDLVTFDRLLGYLWKGDICVNHLIVAKGYASSTKGGALGT
jgi:endonuclease YncB( thermonuclease family)